MSSLSTCVCELRRWHEQKHHFPHYLGWPTTWQTDEEDLHLKAHSKTVMFLSSHVSWRSSQTVGDHSLLQIIIYGDLWQHSRSGTQHLRQIALHSINSTSTYYNTVNKRILITANKRIHIISAYFFTGASNKRMHLLTSLYGISLTWFRH